MENDNLKKEKEIQKLKEKLNKQKKALLEKKEIINDLQNINYNLKKEVNNLKNQCFNKEKIEQFEYSNNDLFNNNNYDYLDSILLSRKGEIILKTN